jgi:hypothetical protein
LYQGIASAMPQHREVRAAFSRWGLRPRWQRLKPVICLRFGMPEQVAENPTIRIRASLQRCRKCCKISVGFSRCAMPNSKEMRFSANCKAGHLLALWHA